MRKVDLIIHGTIVPMVTQDISRGTALAIDQGIIIAHDQADTIFASYTSDTILGSPDMLILPGFINGHTHVGMTLLRGVADEADNVNQWLMNYIYPLEKKLLSEDFVYWSTLLACTEMIQSGITTFADMYFFENAVARAVHHAGMRAILGETVFLTDDLTYAEHFCGEHAHLDPLITPAVAPHSLYSCDAQTVTHAHTFSRDQGLPFIIHVAEQKNEVRDLYKKTGMSPAEYMVSLGILSPEVIIAHGVHFSDADLALISSHGASIIYNPVSNMKLSSGIAHVKSMQQEGIAVGLGTDGAASNNSLNIFSEMKTGALLQKLCLDDYCKPLTPFELVKLATADGARALKIDSRVGTLQVGKRADIIMIESENFHQLPAYDIYSQLVYASSAADVKSVIIDGKIVMHNRAMITLFDKHDELHQKIRFYQKKIRTSL